MFSTVIDKNIHVLFPGCFVHHIIEELNKYCESSDSPKVENRDSKVENRLSLDSCTSSKKNSVTNACLGNQINSPKNSESAVEDASCCGDDGVLDNVRKKSQISDRVLGHFTKEQLSSLIVRNKHGEKTSFCDMGTFCVIFSVIQKQTTSVSVLENTLCACLKMLFNSSL